MRIIKKTLICILAAYGLAATDAQADETTKWPDILVLNITTEDGAFPTCDVVYPPEGCVGTGITNAEYVAGRLVMTLNGDTLYDTGDYIKDESGMRIKIRGNSTGAVDGQKPYKIKLSKKFDMLRRGDNDYKEKDWNMLRISTWNPGLNNAENNILTVLGFIISEAVGMEWTPGYTFVNLVMNGKYMGLYYLTDAVERGDKRVDIKKSGYLIESDAYYWNEDVSFKTNHQPTELGYTYKYPDSDDVDEQTTQKIQDYLNEFEDVLYSGEGDVSEYIDLSMFARWILAQDIMNMGDVLGTNMYIYKYDFDEESPTSTKLKMGPLWDFDTVFKYPEQSDDWSAIHNGTYFYWQELFKRPDFINEYINVWNEVKGSLLDNVVNGFDKLKTTYGNSLAESMELHKTIYPEECKNTLQEQIDELTEKIEDRIDVLDVLTRQLYESSGIESTVTSDEAQPVSVSDIYGIRYNTSNVDMLPKGVYIVKYSNGTAKKILKK